MYQYRAYGLSIHSDLQLPELAASDSQVDVDIRINAERPDNPERQKEIATLQIGESETIYDNGLAGTFRIVNGSRIEIQPQPGISQAVLRRYLVGNVMALLLYQRDNFVLHASAMKINQRGTALLGSMGSGKSSLAATLALRGHGFLADDVCALIRTGTVFSIVPAFPQIKISCEAAASLGIHSETLLFLDELEEKRGLRMDGCFVLEETALERIYILKQGSEDRFERLSSKQALVELVRNSTPTRFPHPGNSAHFRNCLQIANQIPVYRFTYQADLSRLNKLADMLESHTARLS